MEGTSISAQPHLNYCCSIGNPVLTDVPWCPRRPLCLLPPSRLVKQAECTEAPVLTRALKTNRVSIHERRSGCAALNSLRLLEAGKQQRRVSHCSYGPIPSTRGALLDIFIQRHEMTEQPTSQALLVTMPEGKEHWHHIGLRAPAKWLMFLHNSSLELPVWPRRTHEGKKTGNIYWVALGKTTANITSPWRVVATERLIQKKKGAKYR